MVGVDQFILYSPSTRVHFHSSVHMLSPRESECHSSPLSVCTTNNRPSLFSFQRRSLSKFMTMSEDQTTVILPSDKKRKGANTRAVRRSNDASPLHPVYLTLAFCMLWGAWCTPMEVTRRLDGYYWNSLLPREKCLPCLWSRWST